MEFTSLEISSPLFAKIRSMLYENAGIMMTETKVSLVKSRLMKRLRSLGLNNFEQYLRHVENDLSGFELDTMIESLTTNKTSFFRETQHFEFMQKYIMPAFIPGGHLRIWSAGCSSGEEPFSIAILLCESLKSLSRMDVKILATDISNEVLAKAREAEYEQDILIDVPQDFKKKYFEPVRNGNAQKYRVRQAVRNLVKIAKLNLMNDWPMKSNFDVVFCRNVMIYFDKETRTKLVNRFWHVIKPGGYLFVGHSESLTSIAHSFRYVKPAIYKRE